MGDFSAVAQLKSEEDGCVYIYHPRTGRWQKLCDVTSAENIPQDIKAQIKGMSQFIAGAGKESLNDGRL
jgi:hypothetical protein